MEVPVQADLVHQVKVMLEVRDFQEVQESLQGAVGAVLQL